MQSIRSIWKKWFRFQRKKRSICAETERTSANGESLHCTALQDNITVMTLRDSATKLSRISDMEQRQRFQSIKIAVSIATQTRSETRSIQECAAVCISCLDEHRRAENVIGSRQLWLPEHCNPRTRTGSLLLLHNVVRRRIC